MAFIEQNFKIEIGDLKSNSTECSNFALLRFMESVACKHSDIAGYGIKNIPQTHLSWVLLAWKLKIIKLPLYGETIKVITWSRDTEKFTTYRDFEIYGENGELLVLASTKWALIHVEKGLSRISQEIGDSYMPELKHVFDDCKIEKLSPFNGEVTFEYTVLRRDIDINNHMHNVFYLNTANEALPETVYNQDFAKLEIMYKNGAKLGEKIICHYDFVDESHVVTMKSEDDSTLFAIVKYSN